MQKMSKDIQCAEGSTSRLHMN